MEDSAIREGFANLRPDSDYDALYQSALCRAKADWLVGINATRLFSVLYHKTLTVGRVQTPTLKMLVDRDAKILRFQKEKYYTVGIHSGSLKADSGCIADAETANSLKEKCTSAVAVCTSVKREKKTEQPPKLYDLTSLQRDGNRLFGYTAQQVLDYAQALYEKKLLTYPRTDSNYLAEDTAATVPELLEQSVSSLPFSVEVGLTDISRVIDASKVSDHHALLPTMQVKQDALAALPAGERNILTLVIVRLLCAVSEKQVYEDTAVELDCGGTLFAAKGRVVTSPGWKAVEQAFLSTLKQKPEKDDPEPTALPSITEGQSLSGCKAAVREGTTSPPKHFTEDLLLSAMEHASAEEFAEIKDAERTGLGTPATRAGVIEKLVRGGFLERKGRQLLPTKKGHNLIVVLPDSIKSAKLTAEWEASLKEVERGERSADDFLSGIERMTADLVESYRAIQADTSLFDKREPIGKCPRCGKDVVESKLSFLCVDRSCGFTMWKNSRFFTDKHKELTKAVASALLKKGRVKMTGLFSEKKGVAYDAIVVLDDTGKYVNYKLEFDQKKAGAKHE